VNAAVVFRVEDKGTRFLKVVNAAVIFRVEDEGTRFLKDIGTYLANYPD
jgi:hypothetical protein